MQTGVGLGEQSGKGLCSPPDRSDNEYLMLVYSRPLILLFCGRGEERTQIVTANSRGGWRRSRDATGCTPAPPRCASAAFLCSAARPCRWTGTVPRSAPSPSAGSEPSGWSSARRCHSPPLRWDGDTFRRRRLAQIKFTGFGSLYHEMKQTTFFFYVSLLKHNYILFLGSFTVFF